jgi:hypothetical protein
MARSVAQRLWVIMLFVGAAALASLAAGAGQARAEASYEYSDTNELVSLVVDAAQLLESKGLEGLKEFAEPGSSWRAAKSYLYVYSAEGDCLYNAGQPELVGKNLKGYQDVDGRLVVQQLMNIAAQPERDAAGWVFFVFQEGNVLSPVWKASYNRKAVLPDGRVVIVGSGSTSLKMERRFVTGSVDEAAALLSARGRDAAFEAIFDDASPFNILGSYVFVLDEKGHTLLDPSFPNMPGRDLSGMTDAIGRAYIRELLDKLAQSDTASTMFFWRPSANDVPQRKVIYARKVSVNGTVYIVGTEYLLPTPIWMK